MEIQTDFKELFEFFNAHEAQYLIVGSYALAFHGAPRYTGDIDVYVKPDNKENANKIIKALTDFGFNSIGLDISDFESEDKVVQLGVSPVRRMVPPINRWLRFRFSSGVGIWT